MNVNVTTTKSARIPAIAVETSIADAPSNTSLNLGALTLKFADGTTESLSALDLSPEILGMALMHGLKQKLVDAAAIARNTDTGASATLGDKKVAVMAVLRRLAEGHWNKPSEAGEGGGSGRGSLIFRALAKMKPNDSTETIEAFLAKLGDKEKASLRANPRVAAVILEIKAEDAQRRVGKGNPLDTDAMLDGFLGGASDE